MWAETQHCGENLGCAGQNQMEDGERVVKNILKKKNQFLCEALPPSNKLLLFHFL